MYSVTFVVPTPSSAESPLGKPRFVDKQEAVRTLSGILRNPTMTEGYVGLSVFELRPTGTNGHTRPADMPTVQMEYSIAKMLRILQFEKEAIRLEQCRPMGNNEIRLHLPSVLTALETVSDILYSSAKRDGDFVLENVGPKVRVMTSLHR